MMMMFSLFIMLTIITFILMILNFIISKKMNNNRNKISPFECGFDPMSKNRLPFSLHFYLISIIFLIFDIEISLILPVMKSSYFMKFYLFMNLIFIIIVLILGLFMEWYNGALNWNK
nr:NADH dehydrogenase subunit 3 [Sycophaga agraensis]